MKIRTILLAASVMLIAFNSSAIEEIRWDLAWARGVRGTYRGDSVHGEDIAALSDGSALVMGRVNDTATFGVGEQNETSLVSTDTFVFLAKYNTDGTLAWARSVGGSDDDNVKGDAIAALPDGSALVTGYYSKTATFGGGEQNETTLVSIGNSVFVAKYNTDGTLAWVRSDGGTDRDGIVYGNDIAGLADGSVLVTGSFEGIVTFGEGEENETTLVSTTVDVFVAKYSSDGTLVWVRPGGGWGHDSGYGIAALSDGGALVTGRFYGALTFGVGEQNETTLAAIGTDSFVAKYNSDGTLAWARSDGGDGYIVGTSIEALADGSALVTGGFDGPVTLGAGEQNETTLVSTDYDGTLRAKYDFFVAKYNSDGTLAWARPGGSGGRDYGRGIAALADGSVLVTGEFEGSVTFGAGEQNETTLVSMSFGGYFWGRYDFFVAKYNSDGTLAWARRGGGNESDSGNSIAALSDGGALVTGSFLETVTYGGGEANETILVTNSESSNLFVISMTSDVGMVPPDVNTTGVVDAIDIQFVVNNALGLEVEWDCDIDNDGTVNAVDVQLVINAALGI